MPYLLFLSKSWFSLVSFQELLPLLKAEAASLDQLGKYFPNIWFKWCFTGFSSASKLSSGHNPQIWRYWHNLKLQSQLLPLSIQRWLSRAQVPLWRCGPQASCKKRQRWTWMLWPGGRTFEPVRRAVRAWGFRFHQGTQVWQGPWCQMTRLRIHQTVYLDTFSRMKCRWLSPSFRTLSLGTCLTKYPNTSGSNAQTKNFQLEHHKTV